MVSVFKKAKSLLKELTGGKSIYETWDTTLTELEEIAEDKMELEPLTMEEITPVYTPEGVLDYVKFGSSHFGINEVRILRLIRIKNISSIIRTKMNNQKAFADMLKEFGGTDILFVKLDAYRQDEDVIFTYGIAMEGLEKNISHLLLRTNHFLHALRAQFKGAYDNIEINPLTRDEHWIFSENFHFNELSWVRGIPRKDSSKGSKTGSDFYNAQSAAEEESEVFYKGMISKGYDEGPEGSAFLLCSIFEMVNDEHLILGLMDKLHLTVSRLQSTMEQGVFESETIGLPIMMGLGLGDSVGETEQNGTSTTQSTTITNGETEGLSTSTGLTEQTGTSMGKNESQQVATSESNTLTNSSNQSLGGRFMGVGGDAGWGSSDAQGQTNSEGFTTGVNSQETNSTATSTQEQESRSITESTGEQTGLGETRVLGAVASSTNSSTIAAGTSIGSSNGVNRRLFDAAARTALEKAEMNLVRVDSALSVGMFEGRTFILTPNKQVKVKAEALYKQAFLTDGTAFPIRIEKFEERDEKKVMRYAKMLKKTNVKEKRKAILEKERFSTFYTVEEMTAFNPVQTNLPGYTTSHEPIPRSIRIPGKMPKGAFLGYQLNSVLNEKSTQPYHLAKERLSHIGVYGNTGLGKTTFVKRLTMELFNELDANIIVFDWAKDYRAVLDHVKDPTKYHFHSFDPQFYGLRVNLIKPPKNVPAEKWSDALALIFCTAFGLGARSLLIITQLIRELLQQTKNPTMKDLANKIDTEFEDRMQKAGKMMDFNEKSTFSSMRDRLQSWMGEKRDSSGTVIYDRTKTNMYKSFCEEGNFIEIEELLKGDFYRVIECSTIPENEIPFVINGIAAAIAYYKEYNRNHLGKPTYLVFEEAHEVVRELTGNEPTGANETIFEKMNRFSRKFDLFCLYSCQIPEKMPLKVFNTTPIQVTFQIPSIISKEMFVSAGGRDEKRGDKDLVNFMSRLPKGTAVIRESMFNNIVDGEFAAIVVEPLPMDESNIDDAYFKRHYERMKKTRR